MNSPREPAYRWGEPVLARVDLVNDGSYPDAAADAVLVAAGGRGEVVRVGHQVDANVPVYLVDFDGRVVGCFEEELAPLR